MKKKIQQALETLGFKPPSKKKKIDIEDDDLDDEDDYDTHIARERSYFRNT